MKTKLLKTKYGTLATEDGRWTVLTFTQRTYEGYPERVLRDNGRTFYKGHAPLKKLVEMIEAQRTKETPMPV